MEEGRRETRTEHLENQRSLLEHRVNLFTWI
jgi:hypothetical protein